MYLYRFTVKWKEDSAHVILAAYGDQEAYRLVEEEMEKHYLSLPSITDLTLFEKKRIRSGGGYVLPFSDSES